MKTKEQALKLTQNFYYTYVFYLDHIVSRIELNQELTDEEKTSIEELYHIFLPVIQSGLVRDEILYVELFKRLSKIMIFLHGKDEFLKECFGKDNPLIGVIHKYELYQEHDYIPDLTRQEIKTARALLNDSLISLSSFNLGDETMGIYHELMFFLEKGLEQDFKLNHTL